jgi:hypothetical protein
MSRWREGEGWSLRASISLVSKCAREIPQDRLCTTAGRGKDRCSRPRAASSEALFSRFSPGATFSLSTPSASLRFTVFRLQHAFDACCGSEQNFTRATRPHTRTQAHTQAHSHFFLREAYTLCSTVLLPSLLVFLFHFLSFCSLFFF